METKSQLIKTAVGSVLEIIADKQFQEMRLNRHKYDAMLNNIPSGNEKQKFQIGQIVKSLGTGTYKAGVIMEITDAYEENGYWKYVCGHGKKIKGKFKFNCNERQKDLGENI